jgi:FMN-dependent NADH-azoreductase
VLIVELEAAATIVLAVPMYDFSITWIDYVARAGCTFLYVAAGPEVLLKGKLAFAARGPTPT